MRRDIRVTICADSKEFESLRADWDELLDHSASHSIFLSWDWLFCWWRHFGGDRHLRLVLARDAQGTLLGIAPLFMDRCGLARTSRRLRFLGTEMVSSDYLDFIVRSGLERKVTAAILDALSSISDSTGRVELTDLLPSSAVLERLDPAGQPRFVSDRFLGEICPFLPLPPSREAFAKALGPKVRANLKRKVRLLEGIGVAFGHTDAPAEIPAALDSFYALHALRWNSKGLKGNFADPRVRSFHLDVTARLAPRGRFRLYWLRLGDRPIASLYGLEYRDIFFSYQTGFDPASPSPALRQSQYSPGVALIGKCMEDAVDRELREFDFLRGPERFKFEWTRLYRRTHRLTLVSRRDWGERASLWAEVSARRGKASLKRVLRARTAIPTEITEVEAGHSGRRA